MELFGLRLDPFQEQAIRSLEQGRSVLVSAPTGTGKTLVADWVVKTALDRGREVVYTAPIKALSNQKFRDYVKLFGEEKVGLVTGDLVIRRDAPCRVMTTEILRNMLLSGEKLDRLDAVVIDEIHFLDDRERGTTWEEVLIYLDKAVQIVGLSATISNLDDFGAWLRSVRGEALDVIVEERRTVPLRFLVASRRGGLMEPAEMDRQARKLQHEGARQPGGGGGERFDRGGRRPQRGGKRSFQEQRSQGGQGGRGRDRQGDRGHVPRPTRHSEVFALLEPDNLPYLYFVFSRKNAELYAKGLVQHLHRPLLDMGERREMEARLDDFQMKHQGVLDDTLSELYRDGIAFHHAGLHVLLKALVEELYEARLIKVLYCTSTFALGINMPARAAVFDSLQRYDGQKLIWLPTREFMQMAGRAGRRGMDESGLVIVRTDPEEFETLGPVLQRHLLGKYEPVRSSFSLSFNSVVNLLARHPHAKIREIVEKSFLSFHRARKSAERSQRRGKKDPGSTQTWDEFQEKIRFLQDWGYIAEDGTFLAGALALQHMQIQEIFVTEVFLAGLFEGLDSATLFGVFTAMCMELPRGAFTRLGREFKGLGRSIDRVRHSDMVVSAEQLTRVQVVWDPILIGFGKLWADGRPLNEILLNLQCPTDISGDLVGAFRRAKDLAGQLMGVWADDPSRIAMLRALIRSVSRDEVEVVD
jgi:ATP-dependent RNA helicase HelY